MNRRLLLGLAPVAALAAAAVASAQPSGPPPEGGRRVIMMRGGPGGGDHVMLGGPEMKAFHEAMQKQHAEDLKTVLRLRPDQEPALKAFLESGGHGGGGPTIRFERKLGPGEKPPEMAPPKPMTTPERLAEMAKHEEMMTAEMKKHREALAKFYAALGPDQQKVFDALQRLHGPGGHRMGHGGGHGGPGMRRIEIRRGGPGGPGGPGHGPD